MMRQLLCGLACLALLMAPAGHDRIAPIIIRTPTAEEVSIYRIVLQSFLNQSKQPLKLVDRISVRDSVSSLHPTDGITGPDVSPRKIRSILQVNVAVTQGMPVTLVDSDRFNRPARNDAPEITSPKAPHPRHRRTDIRKKKSTRSVFSSTLLSLSTIAFDPTHQTAVVSYRFICGRLCGDGGTFVLQRSGSSWKILHKIVEWIS